MKVKVLEEFTDKNTQKRHAINEVFDCTDERLAEIQSVSKKLVAVVEEPATDDAEEPAKVEPAKRTKTKEVKE